MAVKPRIFSKGRIVIPKQARDTLGLKPSDMGGVELLEGKGAIIKPAVKPPPEIFVKAGNEIVEKGLQEAKKADEVKNRKLLQSLGVKK